MPSKLPRINFVISQEEYDAVQRYKENHNIKNLSQAYISLIRLGLEELQQDIVLPQTNKAPSVSDEAMRIAAAFDKADTKSKDMVRLALSEYMCVPASKGNGSKLA